MRVGPALLFALACVLFGQIAPANAQFGIFSRIRDSTPTVRGGFQTPGNDGWVRVVTRSGRPPNTARWEQQRQEQAAAAQQSAMARSTGTIYLGLPDREWRGGDFDCEGTMMPGRCVVSNTIGGIVMKCNSLPECRGFQFMTNGDAAPIAVLKGPDSEAALPYQEGAMTYVLIDREDDGQPEVFQLCPCEVDFEKSYWPGTEYIATMLDTCLSGQLQCTVAKAERIEQPAAAVAPQGAQGEEPEPTEGVEVMESGPQQAMVQGAVQMVNDEDLA